MHKVFLLTAAMGIMLAPCAQADVLTLPEAETAAANLPQRGMSQADVLKAHGEPATRHAPAGGGSAQQPPITRWDYDGYSVFFEKNLVIDVVVKGAPAPLHNVDELKTEP